MASGTLGDADSNPRGNRCWTEGFSKVYTRKFRNKGPENAGTANSNGKNADSAAVENGSGRENENNSVVQISASDTRATDEANSLKLQAQPQRCDAVSDDSSCGNRPPQEEVDAVGDENRGWGQAISRVSDDRLKINFDAARSENETQGLRMMLLGELDQVRSLFTKLEAKELELRGNSNATLASARSGSDGRGYDLPQYSANGVGDGGGLIRQNLDVDSAVDQHSRPFSQLTVSVMNDRLGSFGKSLETEKRTPKGTQYCQNSELLLGRTKLPPESKKAKPVGGKKRRGKTNYGFDIEKCRKQVFRSCSKVLDRLMKHQYGWIFNSPVDVKGLGLHDYHDIIKHPMDLGTIKSRLAQNYYSSPKELVEDVRLTFHNAMTYNPKGHDVHTVADMLLKIFEDKWKAIEAEYIPELMYRIYEDVSIPFPTITKAKATLFPPKPLSTPSPRTLCRSESMNVPMDPKPSNLAPASRTTVLKKPKAKDPNKRDMTYEEKQKLSKNLQSLPSEKLDNIVQIIKKRNSALSQHDDEIEVDIDNVDAETLWELDRFVSNHKKNSSKKKRKAEIALQSTETTGHEFPSTNETEAVLEVQRESNADDGNLVLGVPIEGEKPTDNADRSRSSSSGTSSSGDSGSSPSDSDSGCSSPPRSDGGKLQRT